MGVKELLAQQDAGFISLGDLIKQMSVEEGVTLQDAATALFRLLYRADKKMLPKWYVRHRVLGVQEIGNSDDALDKLLYIVNHGVFQDEPDDIPF